MKIFTVSIALLLYVHTHGVTVINKPSRSSCISLVQIEDVPQAGKGAQWLHQIARYLPDVVQRIPLAGFTIQERYLLYFQYMSDCERKEEFTRRIMEYLSARIRSFPQYEIRNVDVLPSVNTIEVRGPYWEDG